MFIQSSLSLTTYRITSPFYENMYRQFIEKLQRLEIPKFQHTAPELKPPHMASMNGKNNSRYSTITSSIVSNS